MVPGSGLWAPPRISESMVAVYGDGRFWLASCRGALTLLLGPRSGGHSPCALPRVSAHWLDSGCFPLPSTLPPASEASASFSFCQLHPAAASSHGEEGPSPGRREQYQVRLHHFLSPSAQLGSVCAHAGPNTPPTCVCVCVCVCTRVCRCRYMHAVSGTHSQENADTHRPAPALRHMLRGACILSRGSDPEAEALGTVCIRPGRRRGGG